MFNLIIGQHYFKKKEGTFVGYLASSDFFSDYTKDVYNSLNKILLKTRVQKDLNEVDSFLVSEIHLEFHSIIEELNSEEAEYLSLEDFSKKEELYNNIQRIEFKFVSEIDSNAFTEEVKKILSILRISIQKDFVNYMKNELNVYLEFKEELGDDENE